MIDLVQPFWKPVTWTSFDVVKKVRSVTKADKVGHTGSLDPFAEGVLVLCFGKSTKRVSQLMDLEKEYIAVVKLGVTTDTLDPVGTITKTVPVPPLSEDTILKILDRFVGTIDQVPPMFSAIKRPKTIPGSSSPRRSSAGRPPSSSTKCSKAVTVTASSQRMPSTMAPSATSPAESMALP